MSTLRVDGPAVTRGSDDLLVVDGVRAGYGGGTVLHDVSLRIARGQAVAVLGANGAGKSTLLRCISGLLRVERGSVSFNGRRTSGLRPEKIARLGIAHVPEGRGVFGELTVRENLDLGLFGAPRTSSTSVDQRRIEVFELFPRLAERAPQLAGTLSGGEQQMLAVGRGLMAEPQLLVLDEPSLGLAPIRVQEMTARLLEIKQRGLAVLIVDQNVDAALSLADYGYVLSGGRVVDEGTPEAFRGSDALHRAYLGAEL